MSAKTTSLFVSVILTALSACSSSKGPPRIEYAGGLYELPKKSCIEKVLKDQRDISFKKYEKIQGLQQNSDPWLIKDRYYALQVFHYTYKKYPLAIVIGQNYTDPAFDAFNQTAPEKDVVYSNLYPLGMRTQGTYSYYTRYDYTLGKFVPEHDLPPLLLSQSDVDALQPVMGTLQKGIKEKCDLEKIGKKTSGWMFPTCVLYDGKSSTYCQGTAGIH